MKLNNELKDKANDTLKDQAQRAVMLNGLRGKVNAAIIDAMMSVPRHWFLDSAFRQFAYQDRAFEIGDGQTISRPGTVAVQTELLDLYPGCKVLEVGTGSGYQAYVLDRFEVEVYSIERQQNLYFKTKNLLSSIHSRVRCFYGDGYAGLPQFAPFDRILITCGAPEIPAGLLKQLAPEGIMVVPVGEGDTQVMTRVVKKSDTEFEITRHGDFSFVPMLENKA